MTLEGAEGPPPHGRKRTILEQLTAGEMTAASLAERLGITTAAVRRHLSDLERDELVTRRKGTPSPGRPPYLYRLTEAGRRALPKRHRLLLELLLEAAEERDGAERTRDLLARAGRRFVRRADAEVRTAARDRSWERMARALEESLAWHAEVRAAAGGTRIVEVHQCPFHEVLVPRPRLCGAFFAALFEALLPGAEVRHEAVQDGVTCCRLSVGADGRAPA